MNVAALIKELLQVPNALTLIGILVGVVAGWWFLNVQRKIGAEATASLPLFRFDSNKLPFLVHVTNTNTRQFKINKIGFGTFGRYNNRRKSCSFELTLHAGLLKTDKLLIAEGDSTEIPFDGHEIANQLTREIQRLDMRLTSPELKIWLYLTHGIKVPVDVEPKLSAEIISRINAAPVMTN